MRCNHPAICLNQAPLEFSLHSRILHLHGCHLSRRLEFIRKRKVIFAGGRLFFIQKLSSSQGFEGSSGTSSGAFHATRESGRRTLLLISGAPPMVFLLEDTECWLMAKLKSASL